MFDRKSNYQKNFRLHSLCGINYRMSKRDCNPTFLLQQMQWMSLFKFYSNLKLKPPINLYFILLAMTINI